MPPVWPEVALVTSLFAVGNIVFGHWEEGTPKWRRVLKLFVVTGLVAAISSTAGRVWSFALLGAMAVAVLIIHMWWLPRHGINGWTGEPRDKYYELRGWKKRPASAGQELPGDQPR